MSTHILDVSGARPLTSTVNDPARTAAQCPAKAGDDMAANLSGFRETRLVIPPGARIQRRRYVRHQVAYEDGQIKKDDAGETVYEDTPYEELVLVCGSGFVVFGRTSKDPAAESEPPAFEGTPHTNVMVKRWTEQHFTESGELLDEIPLDLGTWNATIPEEA